MGLLGFVQIFAVSSSELAFIMQVLLDFVVLVIIILLIPQSQTTFQCQDCHNTFFPIWSISSLFCVSGLLFGSPGAVGDLLGGLGANFELLKEQS